MGTHPMCPVRIAMGISRRRPGCWGCIGCHRNGSSLSMRQGANSESEIRRLLRPITGRCESVLRMIGPQLPIRNRTEPTELFGSGLIGYQHQLARIDERMAEIRSTGGGMQLRWGALASQYIACAKVANLV